MYLGRNIVLEGRDYPMAGVFPLTFGLQKKPRAHGYTIVNVERDNPYFSRGSVLRGHEFHYSTVLDTGNDSHSMVFNVQRGKGIVDNKDGICYKNVLASYTHLNATGTPEWADGMVQCAQRYKGQKK